jgi:hypothetical protein
MKLEANNEDNSKGVSLSKEFIVKSIVICVIAIVVLVLGILGYKVFKDLQTKEIIQYASESTSSGDVRVQTININYINKKLVNISELSTAEMTYNGLLTVTEGKIPFITKKGFSMIYRASVKAGIDASLIETILTDDEVIIMLPSAEIQMSWVDPDSIRFYDEKHAIFNWSDKDDVTGAISAAESDVNENSDTKSLLDRASEQAEFIVRGLLEGSVEDREIVIKHGVVSKTDE